MGKLRVLSGAEVCRILEQHGFAALASISEGRALLREGGFPSIWVCNPTALPAVIVHGRQVAKLLRCGVLQVRAVLRDLSEDAGPYWPGLC